MYGQSDDSERVYASTKFVPETEWKLYNSILVTAEQNIDATTVQ